jgi:hypothetical protein
MRRESISRSLPGEGSVVDGKLVASRLGCYIIAGTAHDRS